jgi:hypothetical protein
VLNILRLKPLQTRTKEMGRKIPGRKHKGVKDPLQQQAKRNAMYALK